MQGMGMNSLADMLAPVRIHRGRRCACRQSQLGNNPYMHTSWAPAHHRQLSGCSYHRRVQLLQFCAPSNSPTENKQGCQYSYLSYAARTTI